MNLFFPILNAQKEIKNRFELDVRMEVCISSAVVDAVVAVPTE